jgi:hypothetical protein
LHSGSKRKFPPLDFVASEQNEVDEESVAYFQDLEDDLVGAATDPNSYNAVQKG